MWALFFQYPTTFGSKNVRISFPENVADNVHVLDSNLGLLLPPLLFFHLRFAHMISCPRQVILRTRVVVLARF